MGKKGTGCCHCSECVVEPLSDFVDNKLSLPLILHDAPRDVLKKLAAKTAEQGKYSVDLVDLFTFAQQEIQKLVPTSWLTLAIDTSDLYAVRDKFVDKTQEVISNLKEGSWLARLFVSSGLPTHRGNCGVAMA